MVLNENEGRVNLTNASSFPSAAEFDSHRRGGNQTSYKPVWIKYDLSFFPRLDEFHQLSGLKPSLRLCDRPLAVMLLFSQTFPAKTAFLSLFYPLNRCCGGEIKTRYLVFLTLFHLDLDMFTLGNCTDCLPGQIELLSFGPVRVLEALQSDLHSF